MAISITLNSTRQGALLFSILLLEIKGGEGKGHSAHQLHRPWPYASAYGSACEMGGPWLALMRPLHAPSPPSS